MGTGSDGITMTAAVDNQSATPSLRQRIGRAGGRLRPGIGGFLTWWMHALASWLPPRLRMLLGLAHERVLLQRTGEELRLALRRGDGVQDIGQLPWTAQEAEQGDALLGRSEEHTSELQSLMRISYAVFCLKKKNNRK